MLVKLFALYMQLQFVPIPAACAQETAYFRQSDWVTPYVGVEGPMTVCAADYFEAAGELEADWFWGVFYGGNDEADCGP